VVNEIQLRYIYYIDCNTGLVLLNVWEKYFAIFRPIFAQNGAVKWAFVTLKCLGVWVEVVTELSWCLG
jgi:hypothetical protein